MRPYGLVVDNFAARAPDWYRMRRNNPATFVTARPLLPLERHMHPSDPLTSHALFDAPNRNAPEIAFLKYRLEVIERWPPSGHRAAVIAATLDRIARLERRKMGWSNATDSHSIPI